MNQSEFPSDFNNAHRSGKSAENRLKNFLIENDIPFQFGGNTTIDFTIFSKDKIIYIECTNQNRPGSVEEKIPHKIWKYVKKIGLKEIIIQVGSWKLGNQVIEHIKEIEKTKDIKVIIFTENQVKDYLLSMPKKENNFF